MRSMATLLRLLPTRQTTGNAACYFPENAPGSAFRSSASGLVNSSMIQG